MSRCACLGRIEGLGLQSQLGARLSFPVFIMCRPALSPVAAFSIVSARPPEPPKRVGFLEPGAAIPSGLPFVLFVFSYGCEVGAERKHRLQGYGPRRLRPPQPLTPRGRLRPRCVSRGFLF